METEVGPIKYVAQLVYSNDDATTIDKAVRLLILLLIFVFDPLAILLVVAKDHSMTVSCTVLDAHERPVLQADRYALW